MPGKDNLSFEREREKRKRAREDEFLYFLTETNVKKAKKKSCHRIRLIKLAQT